jgi:hypothetical protein
MPQTREGLGLALEHLDALVIDESASANHLEGDLALGVLLLGFVDDAHAALTEVAEDAVAADARGESRGAGRRCGRSCRLGAG